MKQIYRHVDVLNKNGYQAFVLHKKLGFRCDWFENNTKIAYKASIRTCAGNRERSWFARLRTLKRLLVPPVLSRLYYVRYLVKYWIKPDPRVALIGAFEDSDKLVIPEYYGPEIANFERGITKIIFNQGAYMTFRGYSLQKDKIETPYLSDEVVATCVISEDSYQYLKYVFPAHNVVRLLNGIDSRLFFYSSEKKKQIAYMPRKLPQDIMQVINILKFKGVFREYDLIAIDNKNAADVAKIMRESLIFLSFCAQEGFSLPPAEAMACGCIVVGYHGNGAREYFKEEYSYPVPFGDIVAFSRSVEAVISENRMDSFGLREKGRKASEFILNTYSMEKEEGEIVKFWSAYESH